MVIQAGPSRRQAEYLTAIIKLQRTLGRRPSYRELGKALKVKRESAFETVQRMMLDGFVSIRGNQFRVLGHE